MKCFDVPLSVSPLPWLAGLLAVSLGAMSPALAQNEGEDEGRKPLWELGAVGVGVSQLAYPGADQQVRRGVVLPYVIYRGRVLRADRDTAGLRAIHTDDFDLDVGFSGSFGASSDKIEARRGMPNLGTLIEFGPRMRWKLGDGPGGGRWRFDLPLRGVFDLSDRAAHRGMSLEPEVHFRRESPTGWNYSMSFGVIFADQRLADTFYEVAPRYATAERPAYEAKPGLVAWRVGTTVSRKLGPDWRVFGFARVDHLAGAANRASPLVRRDAGLTAGIGASYTWLRSGTLVDD
jgi:MipA family protein